MANKTIYEYDVLTPADSHPDKEVNSLPQAVFEWLETQALRASESQNTAWLRLTQRSGRRVIQVLNYVGVIQTPYNEQIEVLPKIGREAEDNGEVRKVLIDMLRCLGGFQRILTENAELCATRMPLLEVFIYELLRSIEHVVKRGLRGDYTIQEGNLLSLRGKLMIAQHLRQNIFRADRFFSQYDEFTTNRPVNRLLHSALKRVLVISSSDENQKLARELAFFFTDVPLSENVKSDFQRVRFDRGMDHYHDALGWTRLLLEDQSPLTGVGSHNAPSLLFPMEKVFESFVAKHLARQLVANAALKTQVQKQSLVSHRGHDWFRMKPDLLIRKKGKPRLVLDTKWKLIDASKFSSSDKYGLSQADFYQLLAYGKNYLDGEGDLVLIYPRTDTFENPLEDFQFRKADSLTLWVLPFCLKEKTLLYPDKPIFQELFNQGTLQKIA